MSDLINAGQPWIAEAIALQEEHIKRIGFCQGRTGQAHSFDQFSTAPGKHHRQCWRCGVTETPADFAIKTSQS